MNISVYNVNTVVQSGVLASETPLRVVSFVFSWDWKVSQSSPILLRHPICVSTLSLARVVLVPIHRVNEDLHTSPTLITDVTIRLTNTVYLRNSQHDDY